MAICVHTGAGSPGITAVFDRTFSRNLAHVRSLPIFAFRDLVAHKVPEWFPDLRFGFIEASASWVPYVLHHLSRSRTAGARTSRPRSSRRSWAATHDASTGFDPHVSVRLVEPRGSEPLTLCLQSSSVASLCGPYTRPARPALSRPICRTPSSTFVSIMGWPGSRW